VYIDSTVNYPLVNQKGLKILKGHNNMIGLSGKVISSEPTIQNFDPDLRKCRFNHENDLSLFKVYSYENCLFECSLVASQRYVTRSAKVANAGTPWNLPQNSENTLVSDIWLAKNITDAMRAGINFIKKLQVNSKYGSLNYKNSVNNKFTSQLKTSSCFIIPRKKLQ